MSVKNKANKLWKNIFRYIFITLISIVFLAIVTGSILVIYFRGPIRTSTNEAYDKLKSINANTFRKVTPTVICDNSDYLIAKLSTTEYIYTKYENIPSSAVHAFIATEDKDFFKNKGISISGMSRALVSYIKNKGEITQGGSTITQQLVKNVLLTQEQTFSRKLTEVFIAVEIEKNYTKEKIMEYYLNNISFSNGAYSIASAAQMYFNKPLKDLNLAEITFLSAIPNNPTYYNPLKNYNNVLERQHLMLYNLKEQNYITEAQYEEALNTKVTLDYHAGEAANENYMTSYSIDCAIRALMEKDNFKFQYNFSSDKERSSYEKNYGDVYAAFSKKVREGGYSIYTSFDINLQNQLQESLDMGLFNFRSIDEKTGLYKMQGAAVCIDNATGLVKAAVGGVSQANVPNYFNRAFQAVRQPGSSIKPVLVYTPAFDKGYDPNSTIVDQYLPEGPKNSENKFFGKVTLRYATELSLNTVAYQLLEKETVDYGLSYLYKMNFAHIVDDDKRPIIAIGGFTYGVTPVELASAYSALARGGEFIAPSSIVKIKDKLGNTVYENPMTRTRVYKAQSAYNMTDVLKGVITKRWSTGKGLALQNMPAAGKTGTTSSSKDGWFAGYTPYLTTAVWIGYDTPTAVKDLYGATYPGHIWQDFMNKANAQLEVRDFEKP